MLPIKAPLQSTPDVVAGDDYVDRPFSTSVSLAHGLVSRLVREAVENEERYRRSRRPPPGAPAISKLPAKRALGYRILKQRSIALIPSGHALIIDSHGNQQGLDKRAGFAIVHWNVVQERRRVEVMITYGKPGWRLPLRWCLFTVADHALQRLYYRLKSLCEDHVLDELAIASRTICAWYPLLIAHIEDDMSIGIPTPQGMLILKRIPTTAPHSPCDLIATTWVNDAQISSREGQESAVRAARERQGIVVQVGGNYLPLSLERNLDRFIVHPRPYSNVFYVEMLRHLPFAEPLFNIVYEQGLGTHQPRPRTIPLKIAQARGQIP